MPKGPRGEKRPADAIGRAVMVAKIATGEIEENVANAAATLGSKGGNARASKLTPKERKLIARKAAQARWSRSAGKDRQKTP